MVNCCAHKCRSRSERKVDGVTFHRFPSDMKMKIIWINNINLKHWTPTMNSRICSKHFEEKYFYKTDQRINLLDKAIPTLFHKVPIYMQRNKEPNWSINELNYSTSNREIDKYEEVYNNNSFNTTECTANNNLKKKVVIRRRKQKTNQIDTAEQFLKSNNNIEEIFCEDIIRNSSPKEQIEFLTVIDGDSISSTTEASQKRSPISSAVILEDHSTTSNNLDSSIADFVDWEMETSSLENCDNKRKDQLHFLGESSSDEMDDPVKCKMRWKIVEETVTDLKIKIKQLQRQNRNLSREVKNFQSLFKYLEENNFLNEYAKAAVEAVLHEEDNSAP